MTDSYHVRHDWEGAESVSLTVVSAVSTVTDKPPLEMMPLNDAIDPDALDALFEPTSDETHREEGCVSFTYHGRPITVFASGEIVVGAPDDSRGQETTARRGPRAAAIEAAFDVQRSAVTQGQRAAIQTLSMQRTMISRLQRLTKRTLSWQSRVNRLALHAVEE